MTVHPAAQTGSNVCRTSAANGRFVGAIGTSVPLEAQKDGGGGGEGEGRVGEKVPINRCETPLSVTNLLAGWPTPRHDEINEIR